MKVKTYQLSANSDIKNKILGSKFGYSPSSTREKENSENSSTPLDSIKDIDGKKRHSFELEI